MIKEVEEIVQKIAQDAKVSDDYVYSLKLGTYPNYNELKKKDNPFKKQVLLYCIQKTSNQNALNKHDDLLVNICKEIPKQLFRSDLDFTIDELLHYIEVATIELNRFINWFPSKLILNHIEKISKKNPLSIEQAQNLKNMLRFFEGDDTLLLKVRNILAHEEGSTEIIPVLLDDEDDIGRIINEQITKFDNPQKAAYYQLLALLKKSTQSRPSTKFEKELKQVVMSIGEVNFKTVVKDWLYQLKQINPVIERHTNTYTNEYTQQTYDYSYTTHSYLKETTLVFAKGLVWSVEHYSDTEQIQSVAEFAEKCFKKIPGKGPLAMGVGNACIYVLSTLGLEGVRYLSRLKLKIRQASTQSTIEAYIRSQAVSLGVTPSEIEDMATPGFGLENGCAEEVMDGYKAVLSIEGIGKVKLEWFKPDVGLMKSVPTVVKDHHKEALKELKNDQAEIQKTLTTQRDRLDQGFKLDRIWTWEAFQTYYFMHGLMAFITKKMIWIFEVKQQSIPVFYLNGQWVDVQENPIDDKVVKSVKLWHPVFYETKEVMEWRNFLTKHQIQQPLKQAYREIYLLTEAEVNTRDYSNRMAAHILKQHQFNSLAKLRGWKYSLLGAYDKGYETEIALIQLPKNYKAEFWVQEVNADGEWNDTGIYNYVSTDQVRFYKDELQLQMVDVPPLLFSEVMRDVDLFVGVGSVGNDPNWRDGGLQQYRTYWESYSFGDLTEVAKTRKQVLENLIPRLKIASQCEITDKFLVVKGSLRIYKIHIGSGNILMEPNDQYLCIVADRKSEDLGSKVFLPFEGDNVLSIIISKAFLLVQDTLIKDTTITSQIKRR